MTDLSTLSNVQAGAIMCSPMQSVNRAKCGPG